MSENKTEWFSEWFNSPYYHILYKHRDFIEAELFIKNISSLLSFKSGQKALDVGCGRGRHAILLNQQGLDVTGIDISQENIQYASRFQKADLKFFEKDMRFVVEENHYDYVFNLFTSFGYFDQEEHNYQTMSAFAKELKSGGKLVIDFMNCRRIIEGLIKQEEKLIDGILFKISRKVEESFIVKMIEFEDKGKKINYEEKVRIINEEDFLKYFNFAGISVDKIFGNYNLDPYNSLKSERIIFIASKNN
ncbi:MAG: methyltransferase domain-containing protein [Cytophagaceae bacterium]|nr:methyltransferase domain-containing protein [Cytophagaceae bacterium]